LTHFGAASLFGGKAVSVINSVADLNNSFRQEVLVRGYTNKGRMTDTLSFEPFAESVLNLGLRNAFEKEGAIIARL
jgi:hypothetical protein